MFVLGTESKLLGLGVVAEATFQTDLGDLVGDGLHSVAPAAQDVRAVQDVLDGHGAAWSLVSCVQSHPLFDEADEVGGRGHILFVGLARRKHCG